MWPCQGPQYLRSRAMARTETDCIYRKYQPQRPRLQSSTAIYTDPLPRLARPPPPHSVVINLTPCSVIYNKRPKLSAFYCSSIGAHYPTDPSFSVCVSHFFIPHHPKSGQSQCLAGCCRREKCKSAQYVALRFSHKVIYPKEME